MVRKGTLAQYQEHSLQGSSDSGFFLGEFSLFIIPILCHMFLSFFFFKAVKAVGNYRLNRIKRQFFNTLNL